MHPCSHQLSSNNSTSSCTEQSILLLDSCKPLSLLCLPYVGVVGICREIRYLYVIWWWSYSPDFSNPCLLCWWLPWTGACFWLWNQWLPQMPCKVRRAWTTGGKLPILWPHESSGGTVNIQEQSWWICVHVCWCWDQTNCSSILGVSITLRYLSGDHTWHLAPALPGCDETPHILGYKCIQLEQDQNLFQMLPPKPQCLFLFEGNLVLFLSNWKRTHRHVPSCLDLLWT